MESFLSLPRFAKTGLAVLLAVALLGWGIVAYSSKSQHEDAKSLQQALAALDGKTQAEQSVKVELEDIQARLAAADTDLLATVQDKATLEDQVTQLETDLGEREATVTDLEERLASLRSDDNASSETTKALGLVGAQGADVDVATLRERLTKARTALSARSATLGQRDRELEQIKVELDTANADIGDLQSDLVEQGVLHERLSKTMTALSGRTATLAQRDRELEQARTELDAANSNIEGLESDLAEQGVLQKRLRTAMTTLSGRTATLAQRDRQLEQARAELDTAKSNVEGLESNLVEQGVLQKRLRTAMTTLSGRTATLAQRDRELQGLKAEYEEASSKIATLEASIAKEGVLRQRLSATMTKLSGQRAMLGQRDRAFAGLKEEHETLLSKVANFEADMAEREATDQTLSSIQLRVDRAERALENGTEALKVNQQKLADGETSLAKLETETETIEQTIQEKEELVARREQDLASLEDKISSEEGTLANLASALEEQKSEIEDSKKQFAELKVAEAETEESIQGLTAELEQQETALTDQEDAISDADARLIKLKDEVTVTEGRIAEAEKILGQKINELDDRQQDVKAVEATLSALKEDRAATATETANLQNAISDQEAVLKDLEIAKGDLEKTNIELGYQKEVLEERQEQIQIAEDRLKELQQAVQDGTEGVQTVAQIPLAAVNSDNLAVLPVDPIYEPFPVQTPMGVRLTQVHFDMGSAELTPGGLRKAKETAAWIKEQDVDKIRLVGFTDSIGTKANNRALAKRRAQALLRVFEEQGLDPNRIEIVAKGEDGTREVTEDHTAEPLNRCVGVFIGADG